MSTTQEDLDLQDDLDDEEPAEGDEGGKGGDDKSNEAFDEARARKTIENQRKSEKALKKELQAASARLREIEDRDKPAAEKAQRDLQEAQEKVNTLTNRVRKSNLKASVMEEATNLRFRSPQLAARLVDLDEVEWDENDEPANVKDLLEEILKLDPSLKGRIRRTTTDEDDEDEENEGGSGRRRSSSGGQDSMNRQIRRMVGQ